MIKVTVLYNLPPGTDEAEFLKWRMTSHHEANIQRPGLLKSTFHIIERTAQIGPERPATTTPPYRFMTEAYYPDWETYERSWMDPAEQARLVPAVAKISDSVFLVSEQLQDWEKGDG